MRHVSHEGEARRALFFVHVMKTGGSPFLLQARANVSDDRIWGPTLTGSWAPEGQGFDDFARYTTLEPLHALDPAQRRQYPMFMGHVPFCATELVDPDTATFSLLREPVARTLSYLDQCARTLPEHQGLPLEAIYEDTWYVERFMGDHQTKIFSMTLEEALTPTPRPPTPPPEVVAALVADGLLETARYFIDVLDAPYSRPLPLDRARLAAAKANVERLTVVGLHEEYAAAVRRIMARMGWRMVEDEQANVGRPVEVPDSLRRRIAEDTQLDQELYEHARAVVADSEPSFRRMYAR
jgi:hypothetical protein